MAKAKKTRYVIANQDGFSVVSADKKSVIHKFNDCFSKLETDGDDFVYSWDNFIGKGKIKLPGHVFYSLIEYGVILNTETGDTSKTHIAKICSSLYTEEKNNG